MGYEKPDPRSVKGWRMGRLLGFGVLLLIVTGAVIVTFLVDDLSWGRIPVLLTGGGILALSLAGVYFLPLIEYRQWQYLVTDEKVEISHGIFFVTTSIIPILRIQHISMQQGPIYRKLGLYTVSIALASGKFNIVGLSEDRARQVSETLRARLYARIGGTGQGQDPRAKGVAS